MILGSLILLILVLMLGGVFYVVDAYGIMKLMEAKGYDQLYRAWVPFLNSYLLGEIVEDELQGHQLVFPGYTKWIFALYFVAGAVPLIGNLAVIAGGIYVLVLCCIMADKYKTVASMLISSLFALGGIGYAIVASKIAGNGSVKVDYEASAAADKPEFVKADFTVEAADEKSEAEPAPKKREPVVAKPQTQGTIIGVPETKKAVDVEFEVKTDKAAPAVEETPVVEVTPAVEETPVVEVAPVVEEITSDEVKEFDVPLAADPTIIEIEVEE